MIAIISFFIMMFEKPQIMFNGVSSQVVDNTSDLRFQFSVYNGNFFEFDFENIKAVVSMQQWLRKISNLTLCV